MTPSSGVLQTCCLRDALAAVAWCHRGRLQNAAGLHWSHFGRKTQSKGRSLFIPGGAENKFDVVTFSILDFERPRSHRKSLWPSVRALWKARAFLTEALFVWFGRPWPGVVTGVYDTAAAWFFSLICRILTPRMCRLSTEIRLLRIIW